MRAFRFQANGRELAAVFHGADGQCGVLFCNPFGQEAVRVHRMQRVLAERLSRAGLPVLRVDWFGCGDSLGDDAEGDLLGWRDDLLAADQRLRRMGGCTRTIWIGMRLGATLAVLASMDARPAPAGLVLWEPVTDGAVYLEQLRLDHRRALATAYGPWLRDPSVPASGADEAIGFAIGDRLSRQLVSLSLFGSVLRVPAVIIAPPGHPALAWRAAPDVPPPRVVPFAHRFDWTAEEAINTALVPADAVALLLQAVEGLR
mgnify:CR=1 FL=1